jgi:hypothetical protein
MKPLKSAGWLALTMAASGALPVVLVVSRTFGRQSVFCSSTPCFVEAVLWSLPAYAAVLAIVFSLILVASALERARVGPSVVRIAALGAAIAGAVAYIVVSLVGIDIAWAGAFSGRLSPPGPTPLLPPVLATLTPQLWWLALMLIGISIGLTSLLLLPVGAPRPLVILGFVAGVGCAALIPYSSGWGYAVSQYALPAEFLGITVWALCVAVFLVRRSPDSF